MMPTVTRRWSRAALRTSPPKTKKTSPPPADTANRLESAIFAKFPIIPGVGDRPYEDRDFKCQALSQARHAYNDFYKKEGYLGEGAPPFHEWVNMLPAKIRAPVGSGGGPGVDNFLAKIVAYAGPGGCREQDLAEIMGGPFKPLNYWVPAGMDVSQNTHRFPAPAAAGIGQRTRRARRQPSKKKRQPSKKKRQSAKNKGRRSSKGKKQSR